MGADLYRIVISAFADYSKAVYLSFQDFQGAAVSLATLMMIIIGLQYMYAEKQPSRKLLRVVFSLPFAAMFVFGSGNVFFSDVLIPVFSEFPKSMTIWFLTIGGNLAGASGAATLDAAYSPLFESIYQLQNAADASSSTIGFSGTSIKLWLASALLLATHGLTYAAFYVTQIMSAGSLYIFLAISPPFLYFFVFEETRGWGASWLREMIKYAIMGPLAGAVMAVTMHSTNTILRLFSRSLESSPGGSIDVFTMEYGMALLIGLFTIYLLKQVPDMAASLTGGAQSIASTYAPSIKQIVKGK